MGLPAHDSHVPPLVHYPRVPQVTMGGGGELTPPPYLALYMSTNVFINGTSKKPARRSEKRCIHADLTLTYMYIADVHKYKTND